MKPCALGATLETKVGVRTEAVLLRVTVGQEDRCDGRPLYEAIVKKALQHGMAGATAIPCPAGFGRSRYVRSELNVDAGAQVPVVIEIVDTEEQIDRFLTTLHGMVESGLVTMEKVRAIHYRRETR